MELGSLKGQTINTVDQTTWKIEADGNTLMKMKQYIARMEYIQLETKKHGNGNHEKDYTAQDTSDPMVRWYQ